MSDITPYDSSSRAAEQAIDETPEAPLARDGRRRTPNRALEVLWLVLGIIGIAGLVYGGAVLLGSTVLSPKSWAERYVSLISTGEFAEATALVEPQMDPAQLLLLEGAVPDETIANVVVTPVSEVGPSARVNVAFDMGGTRHESELSLWRRTSFFGLASEWRVSTPLLGSVRLTSTGPDELSVGGVDVAVPGTATYPAYPGVYAVEIAGESGYFELPSPVSAAIPANDTIEVPVTGTATDVFDEAAQAAVASLIDECATSDDIAPIGCPFGAVLYEEYQHLSWKITDYPVVEISDDGTRFETTKKGRAFARFEQENFSGRGWVDGSYADKFSVTGTLTLQNGEIVAAFDDGAGGTVN